VGNRKAGMTMMAPKGIKDVQARRLKLEERPWTLNCEGPAREKACTVIETDTTEYLTERP